MRRCLRGGPPGERPGRLVEAVSGDPADGQRQERATAHCGRVAVRPEQVPLGEAIALPNRSRSMRRSHGSTDGSTSRPSVKGAPGGTPETFRLSDTPPRGWSPRRRAASGSSRPGRCTARPRAMCRRALPVASGPEDPVFGRKRPRPVTPGLPAPSRRSVSADPAAGVFRAGPRSRSASVPRTPRAGAGGKVRPVRWTAQRDGHRDEELPRPSRSACFEECGQRAPCAPCLRTGVVSRGSPRACGVPSSSGASSRTCASPLSPTADGAVPHCSARCRAPRLTQAAPASPTGRRATRGPP